MWNSITAELKYNKTMNILFLVILTTLLTAGVVNGKFGLESDAESRIYNLVVLFSFLLSMFTRKRPQRDKMFRMLPISDYQTALAEMMIVPLMYGSLNIIALLSIFVAAGSVSSELIVRMIIDLSLLLLLISKDLISKDLFAFPNKKLFKIRVQYYVIPGTVVWVFLLLLMIDLFNFEIYRNANEFLSSGINPILLFLLAIAVVYLRIKIYQKREHYTKSFYLSLMK